MHLLLTDTLEVETGHIFVPHDTRMTMFSRYEVDGSGWWPEGQY